MSIDNERSLADEPTPVDPSPLTVDGVLSGVRAMRCGLWVRPNLHRLADMQRLVEEIEATPEGADVDDLIDEYEAVKAEFLAREWWVVEQRTAERRAMVRREAAKALGYELNDLNRVVGDDGDRSKEVEVEMHVLADHTVQPEGMTAGKMGEFHASSPGEFQRFEQTVTSVQKTLSDEQAQGVVRDFSSRRSGKTPRS